MLKTVLKVDNQQELVLVFWPDNNYKFVVASTMGKTYAIGDIINEWHWGSYHATIDTAIEEFNRRVGT